MSPLKDGHGEGVTAFQIDAWECRPCQIELRSVMEVWQLGDIFSSAKVCNPITLSNQGSGCEWECGLARELRLGFGHEFFLQALGTQCM